MKPKLEINSVALNLIMINVLITAIYFIWWLVPRHVGNPWLYVFLVMGEIYHIIMAVTFWYTIRPFRKSVSIPSTTAYTPSVDVLIPVAGEPIDIIKTTALSAKFLSYPNHQVYILNDGRVADKSNWKQVEIMAQEIGVFCLTRTQGGGAKAGNLNHALNHTHGEFIAIFDADMVPHHDFLEKTINYFHDQDIGFVQTPQYYKNHQENRVTAGAWDQQKIFFGPILAGKNQDNAAFICGTNVVIRRKALESVGGMDETNIAEDFLTSLKIHQHGWKSYYHAEILAEGLAPQDLESYYKQQFRWARGSLEILFKYNPFFSKHLSWGQKIQYISSALFYLNGVVIMIDMLMPIIYLYTGIQPVAANTTSFAIFFLPFMFLNLYTLSSAVGKNVSFNTFSFTYSLWFLQIQALISLLLGLKTKFNVTPKNAQESNNFRFALPHAIYALVAIIGIIIAITRETLTPSVMTNIAWAIFSIILFIPYFATAINLFPKKELRLLNTFESNYESK